jgi:hypothetical protein
MNIIAEKKEIIQRINEEQDEFVIHAIKELLDSGKGLLDADPELDRQLELAIKEADNGDFVPYGEVLAEFKKKYQ